MRTATFIILLMIGFASTQGQDRATTSPLERSRGAAVDLLTTLKATLVNHLQQGGAAAALALCADTAQVLTESIATRHGVTMRRVSSRWRNPLDAPDEYEAEVLEEFQRRLENGTLSDTTEHAAVSADGRGRIFRYLRPILIQRPCLSCHGEALAPGLTDALKQYYPQDQATGYSEGDLRGAVSVQLVLE